MLTGGARLSPSCRWPTRWWALLGAASGALIGNSWVLAQALQDSRPADHFGQRLALLVILASAGALAGAALSRLPRGRSHRRPAELLRSASSLTAGMFAMLVTLTFLHVGLDAARAFSSRLSTSLTILVVTLAAPGWLLHLIREQLRPSLPSAVVHAPGERDDGA
ncbi:MAG: hypothetical protein ACKO0M_16925 [Cyanobium sp.]